ncbi:MAG: DUF6056 family protein [Akkermansia sp.]
MAFMLLNPFVQVCLALMMFYLASGRRVDPRSWPDVRLFGLALLLLFTCTARPGVTIYWLSGATNYSWGAALWLGFLCLYRELLENRENGEKGKPAKKGFGQWAGVVALGLLAGMTNENNIPGTWLLLGALFVFVRLVRKEKLPLWFYAGVAAQVAGSLCMLLAPGLSARMHSATPGCAEPLSGFWSRWEALPSLLLRMHEYLALPVLLGVAAAWVLWKKFTETGTLSGHGKSLWNSGGIYSGVLCHGSFFRRRRHSGGSCHVLRHPAVRYRRAGPSSYVVRHPRCRAPSADNCGCFSGVVRNMCFFNHT